MYGIEYSPRDVYFWVDKGGVGKTTNALGIKYTMQEEFARKFIIITNQQRTLLKNVLVLNEDLFILKDSDNLSHLKCDKIFDLEGHSKDKLVLDVIKNCNNAIVPTTCDFPELQLCIYSIIEIQRFNPKAKIAVLANKIKSDGEFDFIKAQIKKLGEFNVFRMNDSKALPRMYTDKKSVKEIIQDNKLLEWHFKKIDNYFKELCTYFQ